ncbi:hypothetical protein BH11MYX1_BH11MYX1_19300 [soil metagenome]
MLIVLAILLGLAWVFGFTVFHVASAAIHILLILAVVSLVAHFLRGRASGPRA